MNGTGRFEGNAQTLRILARLEKKVSKNSNNPVEGSVGLNLSFRTLAAILKYDQEISEDDDTDGIKKGYYASEANLVSTIKGAIRARRVAPEKFRTIECSIMDISDDIAYSTYDIEDAFKSNFLNPISMISAPVEILKQVTERVNKSLLKEYGVGARKSFTVEEVLQVITTTFKDIFAQDVPTIAALRGLSDDALAASENYAPVIASIVSKVGNRSSYFASNGYYRTKFTSELVNRFVSSVRLEKTQHKGQECHPTFWEVKMDVGTFTEMEVLKNFVRVALIEAPIFKVFDYRGKGVIKQIFEALQNDGAFKLLPDDFGSAYVKSGDKRNPKARLVCDFIAGMTDDYVCEFHKRLFGPDMISMHRPLQYE